MTDDIHIKDNVLRLNIVDRAKSKAGRDKGNFRALLNKEVFLHAERGQAELDKAYELRSKRLVKRLRDEVLAKLMDEENKI